MNVKMTIWASVDCLSAAKKNDFLFDDIIDFIISFYKQREARRAVEEELANRCQHAPYPEGRTCANKPPLLSRAKKLNLPLGEYAVAGSAWWDVRGIRQSDDLDIVITPRLWQKLEKQADWDVIHYNGFNALQKKDDKFIGVVDAITLPATATNGVKPDLMKWIQTAVVVEGIPLVQLDELIKIKTAYNRSKDQNDIKSMERWREDNDR